MASKKKNPLKVPLLQVLLRIATREYDDAKRVLNKNSIEMAIFRKKLRLAQKEIKRIQKEIKSCQTRPKKNR